jgi:hypothetical protein
MSGNDDDDLQVFEGDDPSSSEDSAKNADSSSSKFAMRPDRRASSSKGGNNKHRPKSSPLLLVQKTRIREMLTPYLPPPVVQAMHRMDPQLEPLVGPEACVTLAGTVIVAWLVLGLVRLILHQTTSGGGGGRRGGRKAIADEDDDDQIMSSKKGKGSSATAAAAADAPYDATVLLCGPRHGGKTCLFYQLSLGVSDLPTVTSIKANVAVSNSKPLTNNNNGKKSSADKENESTDAIMSRIRYVDWPGHAALNDPVLEKSVWNKACTTTKATKNNTDDLRIVLVLDATQPVAAAAETLYELWSRVAQEATKIRQQPQQKLSIFCACHKKDLVKAKNSKRIKIQMRTELQRILSVQKPSWWPLSPDASSATALELNDLPYCKLHFASTSSVATSKEQEPGMDELAAFCLTGQLPSTES